METPALTHSALSAALTGTVATLAVTAALAALARREGKSVLQPVNATSHWLDGPRTGNLRHADLRHTGTGFLTNHAAGIFWALPLTLMMDRDEPVGNIAAKAALVSGLAAVVDYGLVPQRLTPGWEHALGTRGVAVGFAALAAGLFAGALVSRRLLSR
jgi:hypothetical protein